MNQIKETYEQLSTARATLLHALGLTTEGKDHSEFSIALRENYHWFRLDQFLYLSYVQPDPNATDFQAWFEGCKPVVLGRRILGDAPGSPSEPAVFERDGYFAGLYFVSGVLELPQLLVLPLSMEIPQGTQEQIIVYLRKVRDALQAVPNETRH